MDLSYRSDIGVKVLDVIGADQDIIGAMKVLDCVPEAEQSDRGRIRYVMQHRHGSCFEHNMIRLCVTAPIFVWREWHRHRIGFSYNEESARYKQLDPVFFIPRRDRRMMKIDTEKWVPSRPKFMTVDQYFEERIKPTLHPQDSSIKERVEKFADAHYNEQIERMKSVYEPAYKAYKEGLNANFDPGLARDVLPVGIYSSCWVTCNLRSALAFISLRTHEPAAKYVSYPLNEIEEGARELELVVKQTWPLAYEAFNDFGRVGP